MIRFVREQANWRIGTDMSREAAVLVYPDVGCFVTRMWVTPVNAGHALRAILLSIFDTNRRSSQGDRTESDKVRPCIDEHAIFTKRVWFFELLTC